MRKLAFKAAWEAGKILLRYFRSPEIKKIDWRKISTTKADLLAEETIISLIKKNYPTHHILSEEIGKIDGFSSYTWIIDPLDGTHNFMRGNPYFAISIALVHHEQTELGVIYLPFLDELYWAVKGEGAFLGRERLHVSSVRKLKEGYILACKGSEPDCQRFSKAFYRLAPYVKRLSTLGSAAIECIYVASGRADGYLTFKINPWDVGAGILLIEEAGGKVSDFQGKKWPLQQSDFVASNGKIHSALLAKIMGI